MLLALMACGLIASSLDAADPDLRRRALLMQDRDDVLASFDRVAELATSDPDAEVRAEALRCLGWSRDPRALPVLEAAAARNPGAAMQALVAFDPDLGCAAHIDVERGFVRWRYAHCASLE